MLILPAMAKPAVILLVRHAHALDRYTWELPQRERPLSGKGRRQADALAQVLGRHRPSRLLSSPALRCSQSLRPLADALAVGIEIDGRLDEGRPARDADAVIGEVLVPGEAAVLCSHGDVIPSWLEMLGERDSVDVDPYRCGKASVWEIEFRDGRCVRARYHKPPA